MYKILFGVLPWDHWTISIKKLPHDIHFIDFTDINIVKQYIINNNIDIIIALIKQQNFFIIDNYDILKQYTKYIFYNNSKDTINLLNDKFKFNTFMKNNKMADYLPITYISCVNNKQLMHCKYNFPCIYKLCISSGGALSYVIESKTELCKTLLDIKSTNYFIQEYISGAHEYSGHLYVHEGIIKFSKFYHSFNDKKNYIQRGKMVKYNAIDTPSYFNIFEDIFKTLNYTGFACIDYKLDNKINNKINNKIKIFEINPRPGATIVSNVEDFNDMICSCINVFN